MALAKNITTFDRSTEGNTAMALPSVERAPRPAVRPRKARRSAGGTLFMALGWLTVLGLCLFVVHRNTMVLAESSGLTAKREAIAKLEQQIKEKGTHLNVPIEDVTTWAAAHNMTRVATTQTVAADQTVAAPMPAPEVQPQMAVATMAPEKFSLFDTVKGYLAKLSAVGRSTLGSK